MNRIKNHWHATRFCQGPCCTNQAPVWGWLCFQCTTRLTKGLRREYFDLNPEGIEAVHFHVGHWRETVERCCELLRELWETKLDS